MPRKKIVKSLYLDRASDEALLYFVQYELNKMYPGIVRREDWYAAGKELDSIRQVYYVIDNIVKRPDGIMIETKVSTIQDEPRMPGGFKRGIALPRFGFTDYDCKNSMNHNYKREQNTDWVEFFSEHMLEDHERDLYWDRAEEYRQTECKSYDLGARY